MTHPIDLHDTISILIPGAIAITMVCIFKCGSVDEMVQGGASLDISKSLVFLAASYVVGAFLQEAGKYFVKRASIFGVLDDPYYWVLKEQVPCDFLPAADCKRLLKILKLRHSWKKGSAEAGSAEKRKREKDDLQSCFYPIKIKVYAHDAYRLECIKMLSKLHLFSSLMILSLLMPLVYGGMAVSSILINVAQRQEVGCLCCCASHSHYSMWKFLVVLLLSIVCGRASECIYKGFNKAYNRCLYSSYLAIMEKEGKVK